MCVSFSFVSQWQGCVRAHTWIATTQKHFALVASRVLCAFWFVWFGCCYILIQIINYMPFALIFKQDKWMTIMIFRFCYISLSMRFAFVNRFFPCFSSPLPPFVLRCDPIVFCIHSYGVQRNARANGHETTDADLIVFNNLLVTLTEMYFRSFAFALSLAWLLSHCVVIIFVLEIMSKCPSG